MSSFNDAAKKKADLINAAKERAKKGDALAVKPEEEKKYIPPEQAVTRTRIVFDNSGSMGTTNINNAKRGVVEYLRNCTPNQDAAAVHLLENPVDSRNEEDSAAITLVSPNILNSVMMTDLALLASNIDNEAIVSFCGTPLFKTILRALIAEPQATRIVAFSDGEPNYDDRNLESDTIKKAKEKKIPIDTVFFGCAGTTGARTLERVAEATRGIFLVFDPNKVNFAEAFKYLAPTKRLMLMNADFKAKLQRGEVK